MILKRLLLAVAMLCLASAAQAACPPIPFIFAQGAPFNAPQVNSNFASVRDCTNAIGLNPVSGPVTSAVNNVACWDSTTGSVLKNCSTYSTINSPYPSVSNPALPANALQVQVGGDPGVNHAYIKNIANGVFSSLTVPVTTTDSVAAAFSGWTSGSSTGVNNANLVLFGGSFSKANGNNPYGATLTICNCPGFASTSNSGFDFTYMVGYEVDVQSLAKTGGVAPSGAQYGFLAVSQNDVISAGGAYAYYARHSGAAPIGFNYAFYSDDASAAFGGLYLGARDKTGVGPSQGIVFKAREAGGDILGRLEYQQGGNLIHTTAVRSGVLSTNGHYASAALPVTASSCGTSPTITGTSNDTRGIITVGSGTVTACTVNFGAQYTAVPVCVVTSASAAISTGITAIGTTSFITSFGSNAAGVNFSYFCMQ